MSFPDSFKKSLISIDEDNFKSKSLELFSYQFHSCITYRQYCKGIGKNPSNVNSLKEIPFLPIELFKNHAIKSGSWSEEVIFFSSGTTQTGRSKHSVKSVKFYLDLTRETFEKAYGNLNDIKILALLPSYLQQGNSSLIAMVDHFINNAKPGSSYFLDNYDALANELANTEQKKLLIGVSYALLDFAEVNPGKIENAIIMETGGMKGRRKEMIREDLHEKLKSSFGVHSIHSEYGMTELLSQAYGANGVFIFPKWSSILIRDINDPYTYKERGETGGINIIDLANIDSCSFIETKDLGRINKDGFEVLGRFDNSDIRGCNLMI